MMDECDMICELEHWIKYCRSDEVKDKIQEWIFKTLVNDFMYCNWIQAELIDALSKEPDIFIKKYAEIVREKLKDWENIDQILLYIIDKENEDEILKWKHNSI